MKYYGYSGKKSQSRFKSNRKKIIINIVIIVAVIALCVAFALILGNHLRNKLAEAPISTEPVEEIIAPLETESPDPAEGVDFVKNDRAEGEMSAIFGYLDLEGCPDEESARRFVNALKDDGYTGLLFRVRRDDGSYAYASKAASELSRIALPAGVTPAEYLSGALYTASTLGMRSAAYIDLGDVFDPEAVSEVGKTLDRAVVKELSAMGFSEIVFGGLAREGNLTIDYAKKLYAYVSAIRAECPGTDFGLVIDPSVLENPEMTPPLEIVFRFIDFFALDLTNGEVFSPEAISGMIDRFSGSFGAYSILALLDGSNIDAIKSGVAVFSSLKAPNVAFVTPKSDYEEVKDEAGNVDYSSKIVQYSLTATEADETQAGGEND